MDFFKPEDFEGPSALNRWVERDSWNYNEILKFVCMRANEQLKREGIIVYGELNENGFRHKISEVCYTSSKFKALLINITPVEKCKHLKADIDNMSRLYNPRNCLVESVEYYCKCGAKVIPESFKEVP